MIAKIIKGTSFSGVVSYMLSKREGKVKVLQANGVRSSFPDDFGASPEYEKLYTELTGITVLLIEDNHLPTIDSESDIV